MHGPTEGSRGAIRLYGASWSPETRVARHFLERHGVAHDWVEIDRDVVAARELHEKTGSRMVPVLRIGEEWFPAWSPEKGFRYREVAERLDIPISEVTELEEEAR